MALVVKVVFPVAEVLVVSPEVPVVSLEQVPAVSLALADHLTTMVLRSRRLTKRWACANSWSIFFPLS